MDAVAQGQLVTFGITPTHPETAYGYLELTSAANGDGSPVPLKQFVEKPDLARATEMLAAGNFKWNAGIFLFRATDIIAAFKAHAPELMQPVQDALNDAQTDLGFLRLAPEPWGQADDISIDYAVMEKADNLSVVPFEAAWSDLGGWTRSGAKAARMETAWSPAVAPLRSTAGTRCCGRTASRWRWLASGWTMSSRWR